MKSSEKKNLYEGMYIISATLSEEARSQALDRITQLVTETGGEVHKVINWGRRKLRYEVKNRREGYFYLIYFTTSTQSIKDMWHAYHLNEDLLRFFTLRVESVPEEDEIKFKPLTQA